MPKRPEISIKEFADALEVQPAAIIEFDSESFGMRHRSALRCVAVARNTAAFVVSQDGTVSFFWKKDGRVLLKRNVNTANPNLIGA